jgi:hypothetical protein
VDDQSFQKEPDESQRIREAARSSLGPAFAGLWIDHRPDFVVVVAGVGDRASDVAEIVANTPYAALTRYVQTERSLDALDDIAEAAAGQTSPPFDLEIDIRTNSVVLTIARVDAARAAAPVRSGLVIHTAERLSQPSAEIYAGLTLGGGCTAGFSVKDANDRKGIMTAGHCPNTQTFGGVNLPFHQLLRV